MNKNDSSKSKQAKSKRLGGPPIAEEQGAVFRSVAMMSSAPSPILFSSSTTMESKQHVSNATGEAILKTDDFKLRFEKPKTQYRGPVHDDSATIQPYIWTLKETDLPSIPLFHPLERSATTLSDIPLALITQRISNYVRISNIQAKYAKHGENCVECISPDLVKFGIHLWRSDDDVETSSSGSHSSDQDASTTTSVILEIQRFQGCCISMHRIRNEMLQAVLSEDGDTWMSDTSLLNKSNKRVPTTTSCEMVRKLVEEQKVATIEDDGCESKTMDCLPTALDIAKRLLSSKRWDERRFGLDSLMVLCDSSKMMDPSEAAQVARAILLDDVQVWFPLLLPFLSLTEDMVEKDDDIMDYFMCLQLRVLQVLANAVETTCTTTSSLFDWMSSAASSAWRDIILPLAWKNAQLASERPLLAACSIQILNQMAPPTLDNSGGETDVLLKALVHGRQYHQSLEVEAGRLLQRMDE